MRLSLFCLLMLATPVVAQQFTAVEIKRHVYTGGWEHFVGGGLAAFDCDGDHLPELLAAGGKTPVTLFRNRSVRGKTVSFEAQTPEELAIGGVTGAYPIDIDGDGWTDLVFLRVGENQVLRGGPACSFTSFDRLEIAGSGDWTTAFSATWDAGQVLPTMVFGNYVNRDDPNGPFEACASHKLFRPKAANYGDPISLEPGYCTLSMLFTDWARTGRQDLRVSNDRHYYVRGGQEQMWAMEAIPRLYTEADGWVKHQLWGMGIASRDISGDGLPDVFLTSMGDQRFQVAQGAGTPTFRDAAFGFGLTAHRPYIGGDGRPSTGWHAAFGDVQNDGLDDLFVTKGNVEQMPSSAFDDPNNLLIQGSDGVFAERGKDAGLATMARSRGAALADFDLDGRLDIAVVNRRAAMEVYRNTTGEAGQWIGLRLLQDLPNRDAVGAWIEVETASRRQAREITIGGGHAGGSLGPEHFGLGVAKAARVRVIWPDRVVSAWVEVQAGRYLQVRRRGAALDIVDY